MRSIAALFALCTLLPAQTHPNKAVTLRAVLLEQLHATHDKEEWYVPINIAVAGLTPEQARWTPGKDGHSVGQLANHLAFWNERNLAQFKGEKPASWSGNNDETFNSFDAKSWATTIERLDAVMKGWEKAVSEADDEKLAAGTSLIAHIGAHNAYHLGQILYVRKLQGAWNPKNGVK